MPRLTYWLGFLAAVLLAAMPATATASPAGSEGVWAIHADGRILALLELRRDPTAPGGWTGSWSRPQRMTVNQMNVAFDIGGPVVRQPILAAEAQDDALALTIAGRAPGDEPSRFLFRRIDWDHAEFGLDFPGFPPMAVIRADAGAAVAAEWAPGDHPLTTPRPSNAEMAAIFEADQADHRPAAGAAIDWAEVAPRDEERRARTMELLNSGALHSGDDFWHAAFVFQHGTTPDSYLLAHTLAVIAAARGRPDATWIAAATLDRYLQSIGRPQVYGTQYQVPRDQPVTQEPYDRALVSDALRQALGVPPLAEQERRREQMEAQMRALPPTAD